MNYQRYLPIICLLGSVVGFYAITQLWIHEYGGLTWSSDMTGLDLMNSDLPGFEKFIPVIVVVLAAIAAVTSIVSMITPRFWYMPFIGLIMGVAIMAFTSIFSFWTPVDDRVVHIADLGFWLSYLSGVLIIAGEALQYTLLFRKPQRPF